MTRPIEQMIKRYPQLLLDICEGASASQQYRDVVLNGRSCEAYSDRILYIQSEYDKLYNIETDAGKAEILYVENRSDFERILRVLAYRCEPVDIAETTGAMTIRGIINHHKIRQRKMQLMLTNPENFKEEFQKFLAEPEQYKDTLLVLSKGNYSAVAYGETKYDRQSWEQISFTIREYHELTHFISRKLYPKNKDTVRDEVLADCIGLLAATGEYSDSLARRFLGIGKAAPITGGRLMNYVTPETLQGASDYADNIIRILKKTLENHFDSPLSFLRYAEENQLALKKE